MYGATYSVLVFFQHCRGVCHRRVFHMLLIALAAAALVGVSLYELFDDDEDSDARQESQPEPDDASEIVGTSLNEIIFGGPSAQSIDGQGGNDTIEGRGGDDTIVTAAGDDVIRGDDGNDSVEAFGGNDLIQGNDGDDTLRAGTGDDTVQGGLGDDSIGGWRGADDLDGGFGDDEIFGGDDDDTLTGGQGADMLFGQAGDDFVRDNQGADFLSGGDGNDTLDAMDGATDAPDTLFGGLGDDRLRGDAGDTLNGDEGFDVFEVIVDPAATEPVVITDLFGTRPEGVGIFPENGRVIFSNPDGNFLSADALSGPNGINFFEQGDGTMVLVNNQPVVFLQDTTLSRVLSSDIWIANFRLDELEPL